MSAKPKSVSYNAVLRVVGALLLLSCWLLFRWLFKVADPGHRNDPGMLEFAAAWAGFICFSLGCALVFLGEHIFDEVEIAERWRRRPADRAIPSGFRRKELLAKFDISSTKISPHPIDESTSGVFGRR